MHAIGKTFERVRAFTPTASRIRSRSIFGLAQEAMPVRGCAPTWPAWVPPRCDSGFDSNVGRPRQTRRRYAEQRVAGIGAPAARRTAVRSYLQPAEYQQNRCPSPTRYPVTDWLIRHDGHVMVSERRGSIASRRCPQAVQTKRPLHNGAVTMKADVAFSRAIAAQSRRATWRNASRWPVVASIGPLAWWLLRSRGMRAKQRGSTRRSRIIGRPSQRSGKPASAATT